MLSDEQVDALINNSGAPETDPWTTTWERERAIFRAGMMEAARIIESHWPPEATGFRAAATLGAVIRQAAGDTQ